MEEKIEEDEEGNCGKQCGTIVVPVPDNPSAALKRWLKAQSQVFS